MGQPPSIFKPSRDGSKRWKNKEKLAVARIMKDVTFGSPSGVRRYRQSSDYISGKTLSGNAALSLIAKQEWGQSQYQGLYNLSEDKN